MNVLLNLLYTLPSLFSDFQANSFAKDVLDILTLAVGWTGGLLVCAYLFKKEKARHTAG